MKNTLVGRKVTVIAKCQLQGKAGTVTWQSPDGTGVMVEIDGKEEALAPDMVGLPVIDGRAPAQIIELAYKLDMSTSAIKKEQSLFLENEGYFETARGVIQCETFEQWLRLARRKPVHETKEPYQKGDLGYGL